MISDCFLKPASEEIKESVSQCDCMCVCVYSNVSLRNDSSHQQRCKKKKGVTEKAKEENTLVIKLETDTFLLAKKQLDPKTLEDILYLKGSTKQHRIAGLQ